MKSLEEFLSEQQERTVETLAAYIRFHINHEWAHLLAQGHEELLQIYDRAGEAAYGTYAQRLFRPIKRGFDEVGFQCEPSFPGTLSTSREWGEPPDRVRWMWSVPRPAQERPIGALVIKLYHDHTRFRIPRRPEVFAIVETENAAIVDALSRLSTSFRRAAE